MNRQEYINQVRKEVHFVFDREVIENELQNHLEDSICDLMEEGISREEAEAQAVAQMGDPVEVGKQLNKEHHPVLGYMWMLSNILLIVILPFSALAIGSGLWGSFQMLTPAKVEASVEMYPIKIDFEIPTHRVKLDNICVDDYGQYRLTYRAWRKLSYSRAGWSSDLFYLENDSGSYLSTGVMESNNLLGCYGAKDFEWPEDGILRLKLKGTDEIIEIDLEEYCDETR